MLKEGVRQVWQLAMCFSLFVAFRIFSAAPLIPCHKLSALRRAASLCWFLILAKVTSARTPWTDFTAAFPRVLTTKGRGTETQTLEGLHDKEHTQIPTWATELQDAGATTRMGVYIGAGVSAGLALLLITGALILTWYSYSKEKLQNSSLLTLGSPPPLGLANTGAEGMRSQENIYVIEENIYEMEDPYEYYCYVHNEQQS